MYNKSVGHPNLAAKFSMLRTILSREYLSLLQPDVGNCMLCIRKAEDWRNLTIKFCNIRLWISELGEHSICSTTSIHSKYSHRSLKPYELSVRKISLKRWKSSSNSDNKLLSCVTVDRLGFQRTLVIWGLIEGLWRKKTIPISYSDCIRVYNISCANPYTLFKNILFSGIKKIGQIPSYIHLRSSLKQTQKPSSNFLGINQTLRFVEWPSKQLSWYDKNTIFSLLHSIHC